MCLSAFGCHAVLSAIVKSVCVWLKCSVWTILDEITEHLMTTRMLTDCPLCCALIQADAVGHGSLNCNRFPNGRGTSRRKAG